MARSSRWANRERMREYRRKALELLGESCVHCGYDADSRALCFDHVDDDGAQHRTEISSPVTVWIVKRPIEAHKRLQVLCANCNLIKQIDRLDRLARL